MERLFAAGALDVFFTAAQMKKNRPGFVLTVLCTDEKSSELARILLTETTAFGVRMHRAQRLKLRREFQVRETPYGQVRIKLGFFGDELVQAVPEYESCREVAQRARRQRQGRPHRRLDRYSTKAGRLEARLTFRHGFSQISTDDSNRFRARFFERIVGRQGWGVHDREPP